jgi:hypothetical protein
MCAGYYKVMSTNEKKLVVNRAVTENTNEISLLGVGLKANRVDH